MANQLDLQEQEQLDEFKAFWKQYGNLITWTLTLVLLAFAGWNGWNWWQREQSAKAAVLFDQIERAAAAQDAARGGQLFAEMTSRYGRTAFAEQAALVNAKLQLDKGQADAAKAALTWASENAVEDEYKQIARLRLAGLLLDQKKPDDALKVLDGVQSPEFAALAADRRGDVLMAQGKKDEARRAYETAWKGLDDKVDYRRLVDAKLTALGAAPVADAASAAASGAKP